MDFIQVITDYTDIWIPVLVALSGLISAIILAIRKTKAKHKGIDIEQDPKETEETLAIVKEIRPDGTQGDIDIDKTKKTQTKTHITYQKK